MDKPLRFLPNIRFEKANATTGYTWGKPRIESNIIRTIRQPLENMQLDANDIISERWLASDDQELGSVVIINNFGALPLNVLLENSGEEILGPHHIQEHGNYLGSVMKLLDTNKDMKKGGLSTQLHPAEDHPTRPAKPEMWKGQGSVYVGWNKNMSENDIEEAMEKNSLEDHMHVIDLSEGNVLVSGGMIHGIRGNTFLSEWSRAPMASDKKKGNLEDSSVALYDRTDGKTPRPGKENFDESMEILSHADTFNQSDRESLITQPSLLYEDDEGNRIYRLFRTSHVFVDEYEVATELEMDFATRGLPLYLERGSIEIVKEDEVLDTFHAGDECFLPYALEYVTIRSVGSEPALFQTWYIPLAEELEEEEYS